MSITVFVEVLSVVVYDFWYKQQTWICKSLCPSPPPKKKTHTPTVIQIQSKYSNNLKNINLFHLLPGFNHSLLKTARNIVFKLLGKCNLSEYGCHEATISRKKIVFSLDIEQFSIECRK